MSSRNDEGGPMKVDYASRSVGIAPPSHDPVSRGPLIIASLLLFIGLQFSLLILHAQWPPKVGQLVFLAVLIVVCAVPSGARAIVSVLDSIRHPTRRQRRIATIVISAIAVVALLVEARHQLRTFTPRFQDEFSYLIGTRMLAHGRLWMPAHPLAEFFTNFQLLASPVYASCYFPGTAMCFAPGVWLGLPFWIMPLLISGACAGLVYLVFTELVDGVAGIVGVALLLSLGIFRLMSIMAMAQNVSLFFALATIYSWLRWRETKSTSCSIAIGIFAGWHLITRPVDALCILIPLSIAILLDFRSSSLRSIVKTCAIIAIAALPFFAIQIAFNVRVTGSPMRTPFAYMSSLTYPQTAYGFHGFDASIRPPLDLPQVQKYYDMDVVPYVKQHATIGAAMREWRAYRLKATLIELSPGAIPIVLVPLGFLALRERRRWLVVALLPMFIVLYFFYAFYLSHYVIIAIPAMLMLIVLGADRIPRVVPQGALAIALRAFVPLAIVGLSISESSFFNRSAFDDPFRFDDLRTIDGSLSAIPTRAIVLIRFDDKSSPHIEPTYNIDVAWPDDARVIRAHDRGDPRNAKLFQYYAERQPEREVYRYDRGDGTLTDLGNVRDLAARVQSATQPGE